MNQVVGGRGALLFSVTLALLAIFALEGRLPAGEPATPGVAEGVRHTYLTASSPAAGSVTTRPVEEIRLRFSTPVQRQLSSVVVTSADGYTLPSTSVEAVPEGGEDELRVRLREPAPVGRFTVEWRTVGPDNHPVQGSFGFEVGPTEVPGDQLEIREGVAPHAEPPHGHDHDDPPVAPDTLVVAEPVDVGVMAGPSRIEVGTRWLFLLSIIGMIGTVAFRILVLRPLSRPPELRAVADRVLGRTRTLAWSMAILGVVVLPVRLYVQTSAIFGAAGAGQLGTVAFQTPWGMAWLFHALFTLLFIAGLIGSGPEGQSSRGWFAMALAALGLAAIPAISGHAWGAEEARALAVGSVYLHVLAASVWMGGLLTLVLAGLPALRPEPAADRPTGSEVPHFAGFTGLAAMVNAFSRVAVLAVALLVVTGVVTAWVHFGSVLDLVTTDYGRTLLIKIGAALGVFALGFYNWKVIRPALRERQDRGMIRIPSGVELIIGLLVLMITAVLVHQPLPGF